MNISPRPELGQVESGIQGEGVSMYYVLREYIIGRNASRVGFGEGV